MLHTAETYSKHIHLKDKGNRTIFGDAATATLVSNDGFAEIGDFELGTDGSGYRNLIVRSDAMRQPNKFNEVSFDSLGNLVSSDYLYINGSEIFNFTLETVPDLVERTIKKNGLFENDISLYVFHQANKYMLECLFDLMDIEEEKAFVFMSEIGNTVSSTIPIALYEARKDGKLKGHTVIASFGVDYL